MKGTITMYFIRLENVVLENSRLSQDTKDP